MAFVMAIGSDVIGECVGEIDVSVGMENVGVWLCCALICLGIYSVGKVAQVWRQWVLMVPDIGSRLGVFCGLVEEIKNPCGNRGLAG